MLRVLVALAALLLTLVLKLLDAPCLSGMVPGSSHKGLNTLEDIPSSPSQRFSQASLWPGGCRCGLDPGSGSIKGNTKR